MRLGEGLYLELGKRRAPWGWYRDRHYQDAELRALQYDAFWLALADETYEPVPNLRTARRLYYALRWLERYPKPTLRQWPHVRQWQSAPLDRRAPQC